MPPQLRAVVVGTGFGTRVHVPALRGAGYDVVAVVGRDATRTARRAERLGIAHGCGSLAEALELGVDVVTIATPPATHAALCLEAIAAGCHVLCEKPFTLDAAQGRRVADAAAQAGVIGMIGHEYRFTPARALGVRLLQDGAIGDVRTGSFVDHLPLLAEFTMPDWWYDRAAGGGWLMAAGSHLVDWIVSWLGPVSEVGGDLIHTAEDRVDDGYTFALTTAQGAQVIAMSTGGGIGPAFTHARVAGTAGSLWIDGEDLWLADAQSPDGRVVEVPTDLQLPDPEPLRQLIVRGPLEEMTMADVRPYVRLCEALARAIEGAAPAGASAATFADAVEVMEILDAIRSSHR